MKNKSLIISIAIIASILLIGIISYFIFFREEKVNIVYEEDTIADFELYLENLDSNLKYEKTTVTEEYENIKVAYRFTFDDTYGLDIIFVDKNKDYFTEFEENSTIKLNGSDTSIKTERYDNVGLFFFGNEFDQMNNIRLYFANM